MGLWMRVLGAGLLAVGLAAAAPRAAEAALVQMTFSIAGPWTVSPEGSPAPYGLPENPTFQVNALVDNALSGPAAFVSFSLVTPVRTWTLADGIVAAFVDFAADGTVSDVFLALDGGRLALGGSRTAIADSTLSLSQGNVVLSCNECFLVSSRILPAPVPTPAALALFGMGLLGLGAARRLARRAA